MLLDQEKINGILSVLSTLQEVCVELFSSVCTYDKKIFDLLCSDIFLAINTLHGHAVEIVQKYKAISLPKACQCLIASLKRIQVYFLNHPQKCCEKIEFELLPLVQETTMNFYFFACVFPTRNLDRLKNYYQEEMISLSCNKYINESLKTGKYKYDVSIFVMAYNKLNYTKSCVESLLRNLPQNLNYELILVNHGSSDGTKEYFESISPHKQLDLEVNGGGNTAVYRIVEGEFTLMISNDVIVTPNSINNLLACIRSDPSIAWVVPSTPNISNLQTIPAQYDSDEDMEIFCIKNNVSDLYRWEQRVRLVNPMDLRRSSVFYSEQGLGIGGYYHSESAFSFPDDRVSLLLRRGGYKMILAKDAFCHHFGSVTIKNEVQKQGEEKFYLEGRKDFYQAFGVDPWGTGFCYDGHLMHVLVERGFLQKSGHVEILGIQCGLGSNPLKIKELFREYFHQTNVRLTCLTESNVLLQDLAGISDAASVVKTTAQMKKQMGINTYHYLMIEDGFSKIPVMEAIACAWNHKAEKGYLFIRLSPDTAKTIAAKLHCQYEMLTDVWGVFYSHNRKDKFYDKSNPAG